MKKHFTQVFICLIVNFFNLTSLAAEEPYLIGQGRYDITGPAAELGMSGYGNLEQQTAGIHLRQYARSFIVVDKTTNQRIVMVTNDLAMITDSITQAVVKKLQARYGDLYGLDNVLISATHTHSAPGGFSYYTLYSVTALGFNQQNFNAIVDGTYNAIVQAHNNLTSGRIEISRGNIKQAAVNRSVVAYEENPEQEKSLYETNINEEMLLLKFITTDNSATENYRKRNWHVKLVWCSYGFHDSRKPVNFFRQ